MKSLSTEQFNKAMKYEKQFQTAVYSRYLRAQPTSYYTDLSDLCHQLNIRLNLSCPACVLNAVSQLGKMYFETKEAIEAEKSEAQISDTSDTSEESKVEETPKTSPKAVSVTSGKAKSKSNKTNNKTKKK